MLSQHAKLWLNISCNTAGSWAKFKNIWRPKYLVQFRDLGIAVMSRSTLMQHFSDEADHMQHQNQARLRSIVRVVALLALSKILFTIHQVLMYDSRL